MTDRKTWPLSVSTMWAGGNLDEDFYKSLQKSDIHHIEISLAKKEKYEEAEFTKNCKSLVSVMKEYEITPLSLHLPFLSQEPFDPTTADKATRRKIIETQTSILKALAETDIKIAVIHPSAEPYSLFERAERLKYSAETLNEIAEVAESSGIKLAIENLPRTCLTCVHEEHNLLLKEVPKAFACFDTNHSLRQQNVDFIKSLGSKIITTHFSDYDLIDERHLLPFLGRNDCSGIMKSLEEIDYNGPITFEVRSNNVLTTDCILLSYKKLMEA